MPAGSPAVAVDDLVIRYGSTVAVDGLSLRAQFGEVTVLLGPNGAGKTSTVEHLEGYRTAASGRSTVLGLDPIRAHRELTRDVGVMLQSGGIPTGIRPTEVLEQYAGFFEDPLAPDALLDRVGLGERRRTPFRRLSGGERQRLALALAIIGRPRVVFLDEPTAGVDLTGRDLIRTVIADLRRDGVCVVITTHDLDEAERIADHVVIVDHGTVVGSGSVHDLVQGGGGDELRFRAQPGLDVAALSARLGVVVSESGDGDYTAAVAPGPAVVAALTGWLAEHDVQLLDLRAGRQQLTDVFRRLTSEGPADEPDGSEHG